ncbi:MAG: MarR family winged helix-turn-helix transcriptional regulator [Solirubrobacteraceae bacterium]
MAAPPEIDRTAGWPPREAAAWIGLRETYKRLVRALDAELEAGYGLTLSGLELLARLDAVPRARMRLTALALDAGLSLSRVSRIAVALAQRGLIEREPCPDDARAVEAQLTPAGRELLRDAQRSHQALVRRMFFDLLDDAELDVLAAVFERMSPRAAARCTPNPSP